MSVNININLGPEPRCPPGDPPGGDCQTIDLLRRRLDQLIAQMGDQIKPFPAAGVDGFFSHFIISIRFRGGPMAGQLLSLTMPPAVQTVSRSDPFIYRSRDANNKVLIPLPKGCTLSSTISEADFLEHPPGYFVAGKETVWLQILNLDARMDTEMGDIRIILGETLKREHPDLYLPSLGAATSLGDSGFPARLFFNPCALVETPFGSFRAIHGTLSYGRVVEFPPIGTPVTTQKMIPLDAVSDVIALQKKSIAVLPPAAAEIVALTHPIDMPMHLPGDEAFDVVERSIAGKHKTLR